MSPADRKLHQPERSHNLELRSVFHAAGPRAASDSYAREHTACYLDAVLAATLSWLPPAAVVLLAYTILATGTPHTRNPNEQTRLELTTALVNRHTVSLDPVIAVYGTPFDRSVRDGKTYTDKAPGVSLAGVPITWLADFVLPREGGSDLPSYSGLRQLLVWLLVALPAAPFPFVALRRYPGLAPSKRARGSSVGPHRSQHRHRHFRPTHAAGWSGRDPRRLLERPLPRSVSGFGQVIAGPVDPRPAPHLPGESGRRSSYLAALT